MSSGSEVEVRWLGGLLVGDWLVESRGGVDLSVPVVWEWVQDSLEDEVFHSWWCGLFRGAGMSGPCTWSAVQGYLRVLSSVG